MPSAPWKFVQPWQLEMMVETIEQVEKLKADTRDVY
jgi:hypothetical protein